MGKIKDWLQDKEEFTIINDEGDEIPCSTSNGDSLLGLSLGIGTIIFIGWLIHVLSHVERVVKW